MRVLWFGIVFVMFLGLGCGSSQIKEQEVQGQQAQEQQAQEQQVQEQQAQEQQIAQESTETTQQPITYLKKEKDSTEVATEPPTPAIGPDWILAVKIVGPVDSKEKEKIIAAVEKKWFQDKEYAKMAVDEFMNNMTNYGGKKVVTLEITRSYGEYELVIRTDEVEQEDGMYVQNPSSQGPEAQMRGKETVEDVVRELRFLK